MTLTTPGLAAEDAERSEPCTTKKAVFFHGLKKIFRTSRSETTARTWATDEMNDRRDETLITTNEYAYNQSHGTEIVGFEKSPWRFASLTQSCSRSA